MTRRSISPHNLSSLQKLVSNPKNSNKDGFACQVALLIKVVLLNSLDFLQKGSFEDKIQQIT